MICEADIYPVGKLIKTHGLNGEMLYECPQGIPDVGFPYLALKIAGIIIPFFVENIRYKSKTIGFIKLEDIDNEKSAREYLGLTIYLDRNVVDLAESNEIQINYFVGFQLIDENLGYIGKIIDVDESTSNILFIAEKDEQQNLIPATDAFILSIDHEAKEINLKLPEGLLNI